MDSFFKNIEAKNKALHLYNDKLDHLGIAYENIKIETSFGDTHILATGISCGTSLILVHGSNG